MDAESAGARAAGPGRPYVLLSCATSIDGYIDDATGPRLLLSNDADLDRVDEVRAGCDAILVGATTIRTDNPRLLVRSQARQDARTARGTIPTPVKVTITGHGDLDPAAQFFTAGDTSKIVYAASPALDKARERVGAVASVADAGDPADLHRVLADLSARGIGRLMVEGGTAMHTQFLAAGLADELQLVIAPFFVGDARAPRLVRDGAFPWDSGHRARLAGVTQLEDVVLLRYALSDRYPG
jgi:5-amino-6-(5-phosphoribosylamino)uracil reductase